MWGDSHHLGRGRATLGLPLTLAASCLPQFTPPLPPAPSAEVAPEAKLQPQGLGLCTYQPPPFLSPVTPGRLSHLQK